MGEFAAYSQFGYGSELVVIVIITETLSTGSKGRNLNAIPQPIAHREHLYCKSCAKTFAALTNRSLFLCKKRNIGQVNFNSYFKGRAKPESWE